jgi:hypothetical protein
VLNWGARVFRRDEGEPLQTYASACRGEKLDSG